MAQSNGPTNIFCMSRPALGEVIQQLVDFQESCNASEPPSLPFCRDCVKVMMMMNAIQNEHALDG